MYLMASAQLVSEYVNVCNDTKFRATFENLSDKTIFSVNDLDFSIY